MKIAILGAMVEEILPFLDILKDYKKIEFGKNFYYTAKFKNHDLIIAYSKIGKVNSALTASILCEKFGAEILLFSGVAGALKQNLKIGDLIYATKLAQHDLDISIFGHPFGYVPGGAVFIDTDEKLNALAKKTAFDLGINLQSGIIASGDQFICDENKKSWIKDTFDASCAEMEGASVGVVCDALQVPFFILRAISDEAGHKAEFDFDQFVEKSAKISANFILKMVEKLD